jgi:uncharacterized protein (DUF58 family)
LGATKLLFLIGALLIGAIMYEWEGLDRVIVALLFLVGLSWIWSRLSLNRIGLKRVLLSDRIRVGESVREEITFINHAPFPKLWVEIEDQSTLPGHAAGRVVSVGGRRGSSWTVETPAVRRGKFRLGPFVAVGGDPLGLFPRSREIPVEHDLVVYPALLDVSDIAFPTATMSGGFTRNRTLALSSPTVSSVREYTPGDPMNRIAWSATARRGTMMVKEFDPDPTADLWIVLDLSEDGQFDLTDHRSEPAPHGLNRASFGSTVEYIISVGASLAERALNEGRKVGMILNREMPIRLDADNTERQWFRISEVLATAEAFGNRSLVEALTADNRRFTRTNGVVVVSSDPQADWVRAARSLVDRQVSVTAIVVDAGGVYEDDVTPLIERLVAAHVHVHRYPTHTAAPGTSARRVSA